MILNDKFYIDYPYRPEMDGVSVDAQSLMPNNQFALVNEYSWYPQTPPK